MEAKHDLYCWQCCKPDTDLRCTTCIRSFHLNCAVELNGDTIPSEWKCSVCISCEEIENADKVNELLPILIGRISSEESFNALMKPQRIPVNVEHKLVNPINLNNVLDKSHDYTSFNQFYMDICWIVHNCVVMYEEGDGEINQAKSLLAYIIDEINSIRKCPECFANANKQSSTWFTAVCSEPHLIVWTNIVWANKGRGVSHWPAKVLAVDKQQVRPYAHVQFFGDHHCASVPADECYLYSEKNSQPPLTLTSQYLKALEEAKVYIENIRKKYGSFKYDEMKTVLDPMLLEKHVEQMIPDIVEFRRLAFNKVQQTLDDSIKLDSNDDCKDDHKGRDEEGDEREEPFLDHSINSDGSTSEASDLPNASKGVFCSEKNPFICLERIDQSNNLLPKKLSARTLKRSCDLSDHLKDPVKKKARFSDEEDDDDNERLTESDQNDEQSESSYVISSADDAEIAEGILQSVYSDVFNLMHVNNSEVEKLNTEISNLKQKHKKIVAELKHQNKRLQKKFDEVMLQKENEIGMMQANHEIAIASHEKAASHAQTEHASELHLLEQKHADQIAVMEHKIRKVAEDKADFQLKIEQKYCTIIEQMKQSAEESRICKGCKKSLQGQIHCGGNHFLFCDGMCEKIWSAWSKISAKSTENPCNSNTHDSKG